MIPDDDPHDLLPRRGSLRAWPAIVLGLLWLAGAGGVWGFIVGVVPATVLLGAGLTVLLWPGDTRTPSLMALASVLAVLLAVPMAFAGTPWLALAGALLAVMSFLCAGREALLQAGLPAAVPRPPQRVATDLKAAVDEALVGYFTVTARLPGGALARDACERIERVQRWQAAAGRQAPERFHAAPSAPAVVETDAGQRHGLRFDDVRFASDFQPPTGAPAVPAWLADPRNAVCRLRVFRHGEPGRPWLLGIHGYRMGSDGLDLRLFRPQTLVQHLRYNLVVPTLPLHGSRKVGRRSGDRFLDGDPLDLLYAEAQALWDLRRSVAWIRAQEPQARIGVVGYSLGGYNAALLAAHEAGLDFVVAGIAVADFAPMLWQHLPPAHRRYFSSRGLNAERYADLLRVVSPLTLAPQLPRERLGLFAGSADRVVTPDQPLWLSQHWDVPVNWYAGGHLTFRGEAAVTDTLRRASAAAGWSDPAPAPVTPFHQQSDAS